MMEGFWGLKLPFRILKVNNKCKQQCLPAVLKRETTRQPDGKIPSPIKTDQLSEENEAESD